MVTWLCMSLVDSIFSFSLIVLFTDWQNVLTNITAPCTLYVQLSMNRFVSDAFSLHRRIRRVSVSTFFIAVLTSLPKVIWEEGRVAALSHTYAVKSPLVLQWRAPNSPPKVPLPVDRLPNPTTCLIRGPVRHMMQPNGIRIRSAVFPQCTGQTDAHTYVRTDRPIDRPQKSLTTIGRYSTTATRPNNNKRSSSGDEIPERDIRMRYSLRYVHHRSSLYPCCV